MDKGRNAGCTGTVDMVLNGTNATFGVFVLFWEEDSSVSSLPNTGQGDDDQGASLSLIENGNIILRGKVEKTVFPSPDVLKNAHGTVTLTLDKATAGSGRADLKVSATYRFTKVKFAYTEKTETTWDATIIGERVSANAFTGWNNNSTNPTFTAAGTGNKYLYDGRMKIYDPSALVDRSTQRFNVWGVAADTDAAELTAIGTILAAYNTPPQANEVLHTASVQRRSSSVVSITVNWAQNSTLTSLLNPRTVSTRSTLQPYTDSDPYLIPAGSNNVATQLNILFNSSANSWTTNPYLYAASLQPVTPTKRLLVWKYLNPGVQIRGAGSSYPRTVGVRYNATASTMEIFLQINIAAGTGRRKVLPIGVGKGGALGRRVFDFTITRHLKGTTLPDQYPEQINGVNMPHCNAVNNSSFLGLAAGQVMYLGVKFSATFNLLSGGASMLVVYSFHADTAGIIAGEPRATGHLTPVYGDGSHTIPTSQGWVNAAYLGPPFSNCFLPTQEAFTAFTS